MDRNLVLDEDRLAIFAKHYREVVKHNRQSAQYTIELNKFSDMVRTNNIKSRYGAYQQHRVVQYGRFSIKYAYYTYLIAKIKYVRNTGLNTAISRARALKINFVFVQTCA